MANNTSDEFDALLSSYDYTVPGELIATEPVHPRDSAKMLVYSHTLHSTTDDTFAHLDAYMTPGTVLVCNDTKVIPARLHGKTQSGREVEVFVTKINYGSKEGYVLSNRHSDAGDVISIASDVSIRIISKEGKESAVVLESELSWHAVLDHYGSTPIPPYLSHTRLTEQELREEYQTIFARAEGSVAAPTASLHLTNDVLDRLRARGVEIVFVTLHVNLGTFAPLSREAVEAGRLHTEYYEVPLETQKAITQACITGRPVIPVGTTALRTIESAFDRSGACVAPSGETSLFIREGYTFNVARGLITNFHVPKSSLMMLVAALVGREQLLSLYAYAIEHRYRFFSFGDGMLIL
jgi:S-adenosylmethionine:tRNA ribosyltransferase-isomerase